MTMKVEINDFLYDRFCSVCETLEENPNEKIEELIRDFVKKYFDNEGNFTPKKAILFDSAFSNKEQRERGVCLVLNKIRMFGVPYYVVLYDKQIMKVPAVSVKILNDMEKGELN